MNFSFSHELSIRKNLLYNTMNSSATLDLGSLLLSRYVLESWSSGARWLSTKASEHNLKSNSAHCRPAFTKPKDLDPQKASFTPNFPRQ